MESNGEAKKSPPIKPPRSLHTTLSGSTLGAVFYPKPDAIQGVQVGDNFIRLRFHESLYYLQSLKGNRSALVAKSNKKVLTVMDQFTGDLLHSEEFGVVINRLSYAEAKGLLCVQGANKIFLFNTKTFQTIEQIAPFDADYNYDVTIGELGNLYGAAANNGRICIWRYQPAVDPQLGWVKMGSVAIPGSNDFQLWSSGLPVSETADRVKLAVNIRTDQIPYKVVSIDCELDGPTGKFAASQKWLEWSDGGPRHMVKLADGKFAALHTNGQLLLISDANWAGWDHRVPIHPTGLLQMSADSAGLHYFR